MSAEVVGKVKSTRGKNYIVKWDRLSKHTYVSYAGNTYVGKFPTAQAALTQAEFWILKI